MSVFVFHRGVLLPWVPMLMVGKMSDKCQASVRQVRIDCKSTLSSMSSNPYFYGVSSFCICKLSANRCRTNVRRMSGKGLQKNAGTVDLYTYVVTITGNECVSD